MQIPKDQILELLKNQGQGDKAQQADQELPGQVDTDQHGDLLGKLGIDVSSLLGGLGGGKDGGGLGGIAGKIGL